MSQQAAQDPAEGPSPLWPCDGAAYRAAALPPNICAAVVDLLCQRDREALRLAHSSGRACLDARLRRLRIGHDLRASLEQRGAAPPRFPAVELLVLHGTCHTQFWSWEAGALRCVRALPALASLSIIDVRAWGVDKAVSELPVMAPRLDTLRLDGCEVDVATAAFAAARGLPLLRTLEFVRLPDAEKEEWAGFAGAVRAGGALLSLQTLQMCAPQAAVDALAQVHLPSLTKLSLEVRQAKAARRESATKSWPPPGALAAAESVFAQLQELEFAVSEGEGAHGASSNWLHGRAAPRLRRLKVDISGHASSDHVLAVLGCLALPALQSLELRLSALVHQWQDPTGAGLAALLAAPGLAAALASLTVDWDTPQPYYQLDAPGAFAGALADARLPALRELALLGAAAAPPAVATVTSATWAPQLAALRLGDASDRIYPYAKRAAADAMSALTRVQFTALRRLALPHWAWPHPALLFALADARWVGVLNDAPWLGALEVLQAPPLVVQALRRHPFGETLRAMDVRVAAEW